MSKIYGSQGVKRSTYTTDLHQQTSTALGLPFYELCVDGAKATISQPVAKVWGYVCDPQNLLPGEKILRNAVLGYLHPG